MANAERDAFEAVTVEKLEGEFEDRLFADGDEGFGEKSCVREKARALAAGEDDGANGCGDGRFTAVRMRHTI